MGENGDKKGMTVKDYEKTEAYMLSCMNDSAHDKEHVYRVLYYALEIAKPEPDVDYEILITSCLLHDIGRKEQFENPGLCHARVGGDKAYAFLVGAGWTQERALRVKQAVAAHRYRSDNPPESIEAKILFDADKLDVTGAVGIARTCFIKGRWGSRSIPFKVMVLFRMVRRMRKKAFSGNTGVSWKSCIHVSLQSGEKSWQRREERRRQLFTGICLRKCEPLIRGKNC